MEAQIIKTLNFLLRSILVDADCGDVCIMCRMQDHVQTCFTINADNYRPTGILEKLQMIAQHMRRGRQEDAHDFLRCLTEAMQKRLLASHQNLDPVSRETTLLNQIFGGYLRSQVVCCNCGGMSSSFEPFMDLSLDVKDVHSVEEALERYFRVEYLENENMYGCERCNQKVNAQKRFSIQQAPKVLTIQLKRYCAYSDMKLSDTTSFSLTMNLHHYLSDTLDGRSTDVHYELYGVLIHSGITTTSGHYYCCARSSNNNWYLLNDSNVEEIETSDVLREEAYLLFYKQSGVNKELPISNGQGILSSPKLLSSLMLQGNYVANPGACGLKSVITGPQISSASTAARKLFLNGDTTSGEIGPQLSSTNGKSEHKENGPKPPIKMIISGTKSKLVHTENAANDTSSTSTRSRPHRRSRSKSRHSQRDRSHHSRSTSRYRSRSTSQHRSGDRHRSQNIITSGNYHSKMYSGSRHSRSRSRHRTNDRRSRSKSRHGQRDRSRRSRSTSRYRSRSRSQQRSGDRHRSRNNSTIYSDRSAGSRQCRSRSRHRTNDRRRSRSREDRRYRKKSRGHGNRRRERSNSSDFEDYRY